MASVGINRETGQPLVDFAHVVQSLYVIMTTHFGARVMRRSFGSAIPALLGRNIAPSVFLRFATALIVAIELYEPRLRVVQITFPRSSNGPERIRAGQIGVAILGQYIPNGQLGDPTPLGTSQVLIL